ncbi:MAG: DNA-binding protein [Frankiaceae bacterium]|jgi:hypothetical protein|nr:DNA-binding protein [Frankiaceae bacterium]
MTVSPAPAAPDVELLSVPDAAAVAGLSVLKIEQLVKDGALVVIRSPHGRRALPAGFLAPGGAVKHLPAVITLLRDGGYDDESIVRWLYADDPTLPGTPIQALRDNRGTEIKRRAQAAAF